MDIENLEKIMALMEASSLSELDINDGKTHITLKRQSAVHSPIMVEQSLAAPLYVERTGVEKTGTEKTESKTVHGHVLKSPMVGTFYCSPSPSSPTFVEVGASVKKGDVVCIIEAMKMMNQIEADKSGIIEAILVEDGQPIEFDQALFTIV